MSSSDFPELPTELAAGLASEYHRVTAVDPRLRRLQRALADLGLPLPADWAEHITDEEGNESLRFHDISWTVAQRLVAALEDLASRRGSSSASSGGQGSRPSLFSPGPGPAPQLLPPEQPSTVHIEVPR
ncbi:MAG: hypothetical protein ACO3AV_07690 [Ilumatobacteraceae bacterium]